MAADGGVDDLARQKLAKTSRNTNSHLFELQFVQNEFEVHILVSRTSIFRDFVLIME